MSRDGPFKGSSIVFRGKSGMVRTNGKMKKKALLWSFISFSCRMEI
jgi:hypothetical protein